MLNVHNQPAAEAGVGETNCRLAALWRALHSAAYAQLATMCICGRPMAQTPRGGDLWMPVPPKHSYSDCKNRMSASGARNFPILVSGGSSLASAISFMARLASM